MRMPTALDEDDSENAPTAAAAVWEDVARSSRRTGRRGEDSSTEGPSGDAKQPRRRARWRARWWRRVGAGRAGRRAMLSNMALAVALGVALVASTGCVVVAMVQQAQIVARCRAWVNGSCHFSPLQPIQFTGLDLSRQTLCKVQKDVCGCDVWLLRKTLKRVVCMIGGRGGRRQTD
jgi:hypothetical protein